MTAATLIWIQQSPAWMLLGIFLVAFLESLAIAGIVIPGVALLFGLALLAGQGGLSAPACLTAAVTGAIAGDALSFWLGRRYASTLRGMWPLRNHPELLARAEDFFRSHGGKSIVFGRFVGPVRPVMPLVAGSLGMAPARFAVVNAGSALAWGPFYFLPGYLAGAAIDLQALSVHSPWLLAGSLLLIAAGGALLATEIHLHLRTWPLHRPRPATLTALTAGLLFVLFSLLHGWAAIGVDLDQTIHGLFGHRDGSVEHFFLALTLLGDPLLLYSTFALVLLTLWRSGHRKIALCMTGGALLLHLVTVLVKAYFALPRPPGTLYPESFAFPSGHAAGAVFVYGTIAIIALGRLPAAWTRVAGLAAGTFLFLVAASRVYLDVHWCSDVIAGILLGIAVAGLSWRLAAGDRRLLTLALLTRRQLLGVAVAWATCAVLYLFWQWPAALIRYRIESLPS